MNVLKTSANPIGWKKSLLWLVLAAACFHLAYTSIKFPALGLFIFGYAYFLVRLTDQPTVKRAFYFGLAAGFLCAAPQASFFWGIFKQAAIVLWLVFAFWIGLFTAIVCGCNRRWGKAKAMWLIPIVWTGLEYFRSELYYLRFSWLNVGYAFPSYPAAPLYVFGMYGVGFWVFSLAAILSHKNLVKKSRINIFAIILVLLIPLSWFLMFMAAARYERPLPPVKIVGIQMEFPPEGVIPEMLNQALAKNTDAQIFVLSEYTLEGAVPDSLKIWCREHSKFLVVGGKDFVTNDIYYNTAFVVGTNGEIIFKQAKSVPIQFFKDGLPAQKQEVWNSPWGKIGICICYDLSYTRVTDELVKQGAQLFIVPTMDVEEWGRHEHELHSRVALVRAAEYGIPIFRVASSGISQAVLYNGDVIAKTSIPGNGDIFSAQLKLPMRGSLPLDRFLAPVCVGVTGIVIAILLFLNWKDKRAKPNS
ncbi:MAG TPA: nitrilase-related carbon-nitrogen hydrolase [Verrucomicrobiae bacterium]|jgi:apolipoprotein N-acyltransferase